MFVLLDLSRHSEGLDCEAFGTRGTGRGIYCELALWMMLILVDNVRSCDVESISTPWNDLE